MIQKRHSRLLRFLYFCFFFLTLACNKDKLKDDDQEDYAPNYDSTHIDFFVISDWGAHGSRSQKEVAFQMAEYADKISLDFIITGGDNFYEEGVKSVYDPLWESNFENVYNYPSLKVNWYPTLGNHDYYGNPQAQVEYSIVNNFWNLPSRFYTFVSRINSESAIRFIMLDTEGFLNELKDLADGKTYKDIEQYKWFVKIIESSNENWIIVVGHHAIYSAGSTHGGYQALQEIFEPLFSKNQVDFYICGHDHDFEHAKSKKSNTDFFITGTGGDIRPTGENENTIFSISSLGFTYFSISADSAKVFFITNTGKTVYSYTRKEAVQKVLKRNVELAF